MGHLIISLQEVWGYFKCFNNDNTIKRDDVFEADIWNRNVTKSLYYGAVLRKRVKLLPSESIPWKSIYGVYLELWRAARTWAGRSPATRARPRWRSRRERRRTWATWWGRGCRPDTASAPPAARAAAASQIPSVSRPPSSWQTERRQTRFGKHRTKLTRRPLRAALPPDGRQEKLLSSQVTSDSRPWPCRANKSYVHNKKIRAM